MRSASDYENVARDWVRAFDAQDQPALQRLNEHYQRAFTFDDLFAEIWRRVYAFRQRSFRGGERRLLPAEAQLLVAQDVGFGNWETLLRAVATGAPPVTAYAVDPLDGTITPRRRLSTSEWETLLAEMKERRITRL